MTHPVDNHVGKRVRHRRKLLGMTQQAIGALRRHSFSANSKVRKRRQRVLAPAGFGISVARFRSPSSYFFEGLESDAQNGNHVAALDADVMHDKETIDLVRAYYGLAKYPRRRLLELTKALSNAQH